MQQDIIFFSHANGFPAATYHAFLQHFRPFFQVHYVNTFGHAGYKVKDSWLPLVDELSESITGSTAQPVIGMGHSLGGVINLLAAAENPDMFSKLILLDPPIFSHWKRTALRVLKSLKLAERVVPEVAKAANRRDTFPDPESAYLYWKSKGFFKRFEDECLRDYIQFGLRKEDNDYQLVYNKLVESRIFATLHTEFSFDRVQIPVFFFYSDKYEILKKSDLAYLKKVNKNWNFIPIPAGHMFPFQRSKESAQEILNALLP